MRVYKELLVAFAVISVFYLVIFSMAVWLSVVNFNLVNFLFGILNTAGALLLIKNREFPLQNVLYFMLFAIDVGVFLYLLVNLIKDIDLFPFLCHKILYTLVGGIVFLLSALKTTNFIRSKIEGRF